MPGRAHPIITGNIYHVFNKTIDRREIFTENNLCNKFIETITYYRSSATVLRLSKFHQLSEEMKMYYSKHIMDINRLKVFILAFSLMPNHYHLLLKQNQNQGISSFISNIQNSLTRYFNIMNKRVGPIFLHRYKSKPITNEEQLKHTSRYIHLNCYSGHIVNSLSEIISYPWSSFNEYTNPNFKIRICQKNIVLSLFNNDRSLYKKFVLDNANHQRTLEYCKYSSKW